jgi:hypothetical protein
METVIASLITNPNQDELGTGHSEGQTQHIDEGVKFIAADIP